jgi:signal transduction histidine kinase
MFSSVLPISQIEGDNRNLTFRTVNLAELAEEVVKLFEVAAEERDCRIRMRGQERVVVTCGRHLLAMRLPHVIDNI